MIDQRDQQFTQIPPEMLAGIPQQDLASAMGEVSETTKRIRSEMERIIPREHQGAIFSTGETVEIRGQKFRVHAMSGKRLYLDAIAP